MRLLRSFGNPRTGDTSKKETFVFQPRLYANSIVHRRVEDRMANTNLNRIENLGGGSNHIANARKIRQETPPKGEGRKST